jgi:hypothetical protein
MLDFELNRSFHERLLTNYRRLRGIEGRSAESTITQTAIPAPTRIAANQLKTQN